MSDLLSLRTLDGKRLGPFKPRRALTEAIKLLDDGAPRVAIVDSYTGQVIAVLNAARDWTVRL